MIIVELARTNRHQLLGEDHGAAIQHVVQLFYFLSRAPKVEFARKVCQTYCTIQKSRIAGPSEKLNVHLKNFRRQWYRDWKPR